MDEAELKAIKHQPNYRTVLKTLLNRQMRQLVEDFSSLLGEESFIVTVNTTDGTTSHMSSRHGRGFMDDKDYIKTQFRDHCIKNCKDEVEKDNTTEGSSPRYTHQLEGGHHKLSDGGKVPGKTSAVKQLVVVNKPGRVRKAFDSIADCSPVKQMRQHDSATTLDQTAQLEDMNQLDIDDIESKVEGEYIVVDAGMNEIYNIGKSVLAGTHMLGIKAESVEISDGCVDGEGMPDDGEGMPDDGRMEGGDLVAPSSGVQVSAKSTVHHVTRPFICGKCGKGFIFKSYLTRHEKICHNPTNKPFICSKCGKGFIVKTYLSTHEKICHNATNKKTCEFCNESFVYLNIHQKKRCPALGKQPRQYQCEICKANFMERSYLMDHMNYKHKEPRFSCPKCNKKFAFRCSIIRHKKICGRYDGRRSDIESKVKTESGEIGDGGVDGEGMPDDGRMEGDLVDPSSGVSITAKASMHDETRPYICSKCGKGFDVYNKCARHEKTCHTAKETCEFCNRSFLHLQPHQKRCSGVGERKRQHQCEICQVNFLERSYLLEHIQYKHKAPRYSCPKCNKKYSFRASFNNHKKICGLFDGCISVY